VAEDLQKFVVNAPHRHDGTQGERAFVCEGCRLHAPPDENQPLFPINSFHQKNLTNAGAPVVNLEAVRNAIATRNFGQLGDFFLSRLQWMQSRIDPRRDLEGECGYPYAITPWQYRYLYDREGVATRVVNIYPDECWAVDPIIRDTASSTPSSFMKGLEQLVLGPNTDLFHYCHRVDNLSGIGRYGGLLFGFSDGQDLRQPLPHINSDGLPTGKGKDLEVLFIQPFDEAHMHIINYETDLNSRRFGLPLYYHVFFSALQSFTSSVFAVANPPLISKVVHWSRIVHVADNREGSNVFGVPRMQPVFNRLCDTRKILGGSAEMFWKGGFPLIVFEIMPEILMAGLGVTMDQDKLRQSMSDVMNGLQRWMDVIGMSAKMLSPQIANPEGNFTVQMATIAMSIGAPLRIFMGSEQAQLASGQDVRTWNRRLARRHERYLDPWLMRPVVDRLTAVRAVPPPAKRPTILWPDINLPSEDDKSKVSERVTNALFKYVTGSLWQVIDLNSYFTHVVGFSQDRTDQILADLKSGKYEIKGLKLPTVMQAEVKGPPDSAGPPPKGKPKPK
jgi:uncharacterized protein